jgi:DNA-binding NarL/FixJ family response regulator
MEEGFEDVRGISELLPSLMVELETTWRRIGVELERLGISTGMLPAPIQPSACPGLSSLSRREWEIVSLFMEGNRVPNIARTLCISPHTVRNHLQSVYRKLEVGSQAELIEKLKGPPRTSSAVMDLRRAVGDA